jgi:hypothetical protein
MDHANDPRVEYERRRDARRAEAERLDRRDAAIANLRVAVAVVAGILLIAIYRGPRIAAAWLWLPAIGFLALVVIHERVRRAHRRAQRTVAYYDRGLARLDDRWAGQGEAGERFVDANHPYAQDLDLFGKGSLFELLCTVRTQAGEEILADWLRKPAAPETVRDRQRAVEELRDRVDLREDLALLGADLRAEVDPRALAAWGAAPPLLPATAAIRLGMLALAVVTVGLGISYAASALRAIPFLAALAIEGAIFRAWREPLRKVTNAVEQPGRHLPVLAAVVGRLERESFHSARLRELQAALTADGVSASRRIAELGRLVDLLQAQENQFFLPFVVLLLWTPQLACAIERWRARSGPAIARWLTAVGELEALAAFSGHSFERPADPFPEIVDEGAVVDGEELGHPLIPSASCVRNNVRLSDGMRVLLVSGSNMSGKSTLLRTVGTNVVLALAGAPVRARRLRVSSLTVGATLRIQDSLQAGASRFYAEITRLRILVDLAGGTRPLLFLLDEILHGTNSHDRRIGAEAVVRGLVERGAIGLVTTHDLALADLVDGLNAGGVERAANVHFEDHLEEGRLTFDYKMRPGVVRKSNAIELMRAVGLQV